MHNLTFKSSRLSDVLSIKLSELLSIIYLYEMDKSYLVNSRFILERLHMNDKVGQVSNGVYNDCVNYFRLKVIIDVECLVFEILAVDVEQ